MAARGGMEALRPALQRIYMTRASAYRDGLKSFIQGYQEGIKEVMEKKEEYESQQKEDIQKKRPWILDKAYQFVSFSAYQLLQLDV